MKVGQRKLYGLYIGYVCIMVALIGAALSPAITTIFAIAVSSIVSLYTAFATTNIVGEHNKKKNTSKEQENENDSQ